MKIEGKNPVKELLNSGSTIEKVMIANAFLCFVAPYILVK